MAFYSYEEKKRSKECLFMLYLIHGFEKKVPHGLAKMLIEREVVDGWSVINGAYPV